VGNEPKWVTRWVAQRAMGRRQYVLRIGVLGYGAAMFIAMTFFVRRAPLTVTSVLAAAILWAVAGVVFGISVWTISEWRYQRYLRSTAAAPGNDEAT
jgi:hypothetical protein